MIEATTKRNPTVTETRTTDTTVTESSTDPPAIPATHPPTVN